MAEMYVRSDLLAQVDDLDLPLVSRYPWRSLKAPTRIYAVSNVDGRSVYMHQLIMGLPPESLLTVDHCNGNGLDNRRENLRWATRTEQAQNRSAQRGKQVHYKGVQLSGNRFRALITINGERRSLGSFDTAEEAAFAYNECATKAFGAFSRLNPLEKFLQAISSDFSDLTESLR